MFLMGFRLRLGLKYTVVLDATCVSPSVQAESRSLSSTMSSTVESPPSPAMVLGPYYFGIALNAFLYGILVLQLVIYYQGYKSDRSWLRYFVLYLFIVETINTGISIAMVYQPLIGQFGALSPTELNFYIVDPRSSRRSGTAGPMSLFPTLLPSQPLLETAISAPVQIFYAWRIRVIMKSNWIPVLICMATMSSMAGAFWTSVSVVRARSYINHELVNHGALTWTISTVGSDMIICASLITSLVRRKSGMKNTDDAINRIVRNTLQTGAITGAFSILDIVLFVALPNSTLNFTFDFALPKLYSNALISTLNARAGMVHIAINRPHDNVLFSSERPLASNTRNGIATADTTDSVAFRQYASRAEFIEMNTDRIENDTDIASVKGPQVML
ncbi:hypothetical protein D9757_009155 [Collybiopsis confluens]|uniref:DUF6534 domain-containing protein n=1 Tax=Collybiopsis confluens TaxID=2823264 RepID=A0A8H5H7N8_9AGAR|nr:hypothetical protein D9757_009155 [Collybiopsis confluens]